MKSYEPPKVYIIWDSPIGCQKEDITDSPIVRKFLESVAKLTEKRNG